MIQSSRINFNYSFDRKGPIKTMRLKVINKLPRIVFYYKSFSTNQQLAWKQFVVPSRPSALSFSLKDLFSKERIKFKDELGILLSHDNVRKEGDVILAVGVGSGISLIHNCAKPGIHKCFIGIDGSREQIALANANAKLNGIDFSKFEIIEGYAGSPKNLYGELNQQASNFIDINKLKYDVLELDCEGSELEILRDLTAKPRHIIVEMHPMYMDVNLNDFLKDMQNKQYILVKSYTVNGDCVHQDDMHKYYDKDFVQKLRDFKVEWGDGLLVLQFDRMFNS
jgi:2-polyprenyl-3-methyl-5-hydroxy-6-metoxy-1,4-benzoquinol methylase